MAERLKLTLVRSGIGQNKRIRRTLIGLGLTKVHKTVILQNTPAIRGMIEKVAFLVKVEGLV
jgi:large subunit ribosomal protein L30